MEAFAVASPAPNTEVKTMKPRRGLFSLLAGALALGGWGGPPAAPTEPAAQSIPLSQPSKTNVPAPALVLGQIAGVPWRSSHSRTRAGSGGKRPRIGRGRSQMARKARRRTHRKWR